MKVLYLTEISTFPVNGGEKIRSYGLLKIFDEISTHVTAVITNKSDINISDYSKKYKFENTKFISYSPKKQSYSKIILRYFQKNIELLNCIRDLNLSKIDLIVMDYGFLGSSISFFKNYNIPVIYGTHNAEAKLTLQENHSTIIDKIKNKILFSLEYIHEHLYFNKADILLVVSKEDQIYHQKFVNKNKVVVVPNFLDTRLYKKKELCLMNKHLIMTANFDSFQNYNGLKWFLENVWDEDLSSMTSLKLVGKGSKGILKKLNKININNVHEVGMVDEINNYILEATISLVPLLHGGGTRLKCLESMALGIPLVSTSLGAAGIEHMNSILIADTKEEFKKSIKILLKDEKLRKEKSKQGYKVFVEKYSLSTSKEILKSISNNLCK